MIRLLVLCASILLCSSCCNKKACPSDELPFILVKISGLLQANETITLYELNDGKRDSSFIQISDVNPSFTIFPAGDYIDAGLHSRQFIIRHKQKSDTIHSIVATFEDVTIVCDSRWGCGRGLGGKNTKTTLKKLTQFSFVVRGKNYGLNDDLILD